MKVVILAGGLGTRIQELTKTLPKPMINIAGRPIITHIMQHYSNYGFNDFLVAAGYKGEVIRKYFKKKKFKNWKINIFNTGLKTMTGGRLKRLKKYLGKETFLATYGDGVSNVDIRKLIKFHKKNKKLVTLTAVRPPARFGSVKFKKNKIARFKEKSKLDEGWINGGFFVIEPKFLNFIKNDKTLLEREPLELACKKNQLYGFKHEGFWQCMDTVRDKNQIEEIFRNKRNVF